MTSHVFVITFFLLKVKILFLLCTLSKMRDWTCEECTQLKSGLDDYMVQEETIAEGVLD